MSDISKPGGGFQAGSAVGVFYDQAILTKIKCGLTGFHLYCRGKGFEKMLRLYSAMHEEDVKEEVTELGIAVNFWYATVTNTSVSCENQGYSIEEETDPAR